MFPVEQRDAASSAEFGQGEMQVIGDLAGSLGHEVGPVGFGHFDLGLLEDDLTGRSGQPADMVRMGHAL